MVLFCVKLCCCVGWNYGVNLCGIIVLNVGWNYGVILDGVMLDGMMVLSGVDQAKFLVIRTDYQGGESGNS